MPAEPEPSGPLISYDEWLESPARSLFLRTAMYVGDARLDLLEAYLHGFDCGRDGAVLNGFDQWLDMKLRRSGCAGVSHRLIWQVLPEWRDGDPLEPATDTSVRAEYFRLLDEFIAERTKRGLPDILERYRLWREARV